MASQTDLSSALADVIAEHLTEAIEEHISEGNADSIFEEAAKKAADNISWDDYFTDDIVEDAVSECDLEGIITKAIRKGHVDLGDAFSSYLDDHPEVLTEPMDAHLKAAFAGSWDAHIGMHEAEQVKAAEQVASLREGLRSLERTVEVMRQEQESFCRRTASFWGRVRFVLTGR